MNVITKFENFNVNSPAFEKLFGFAKHILEQPDGNVKNEKLYYFFEEFTQFYAGNFVISKSLDGLIEKDDDLRQFVNLEVLLTMLEDFVSGEYDWKIIRTAHDVEKNLKEYWKISIESSDPNERMYEAILKRSKLYSQEKIRKSNDKTGIFEKVNAKNIHEDLLSLSQQIIDNFEKLSNTYDSQLLCKSIYDFFVMFDDLYKSNIALNDSVRNLINAVIPKGMDKFYSIILKYSTDDYDFNRILASHTDVEGVRKLEANKWEKVYMSHRGNGKVEIVYCRKKIFDSEKLRKLDDKTGLLE